MSKRFTETDKWKDEWFMNLKNEHKVLWCYLLDNCNSAGVFEANWRLFNFHIQSQISEKEFKETFANKITKINAKQYIINKFIEFQVGEINPKVPAHRQILRFLRDVGLCSFIINHKEIKGKNYQDYQEINADAYSTLLSRVLRRVQEGFKKGSSTPKDKDREKDKEKEKEKEKELRANILEINKFEPNEIILIWNEKRGSLSKVREMSKKRLDKIRIKLKSYPQKDFWLDSIAKIANSDFCQGKTTKWKATFDWWIEADNALKALEGNYDNNNSGNIDWSQIGIDQ